MSESAAEYISCNAQYLWQVGRWTNRNMWTLLFLCGVLITHQVQGTFHSFLIVLFFFLDFQANLLFCHLIFSTTFASWWLVGAAFVVWKWCYLYVIIHQVQIVATLLVIGGLQQIIGKIHQVIQVKGKIYGTVFVCLCLS